MNAHATRSPLSQIPLLPTIAAGLVLLGFVGSLAGGCGGPGGGFGGGTSLSSLCSAYTTALDGYQIPSVTDSQSMNDYINDADGTDDFNALADAAKDYDDAGVKSDGEHLDGMSGMISESSFRSATSNIASECSGSAQ